MSAAKTNKIYFQNLDSLRAIAALAVVGFHCINGLHFPDEPKYDWIGKIISFNGQGGPLGVAFFFILSGFLITYLLFQEKKEVGKVNVGHFYLRRLLRIWPLYYLTLLIGFVLYPMVMNYMGHGYEEVASGWMFSTFLANFDHIRMQGSPAVGILGVQWSLSVEEQFYLFWPLLFFIKMKPKGYFWSFVILLVGSEIFYWSQDNHYVQYYHLLSNLRFLAMGAILAYLAYAHQEKLTRALSKIPFETKGLLYIIGIMYLFIGNEWKDMQVFHLLNHFVPLFFFSFVIMDQCYAKDPLFPLGRFKALTEIGKISYGVYLLHMIVLFALKNLVGEQDPFYLRVVATFVLTIISAYFIYHYFEKPFLKWKDKFKA